MRYPAISPTIRFFGATIMLLALVVGTLPFFTHCGARLDAAALPGVAPGCMATARAGEMLALPLLLAGMVMSFSRRRAAVKGLAGLAAVSGMAVILFPASITEVCASPLALCHAVMKPTLVSIGMLITGISVFSLVLLQKEQRVTGR